MNPPEPMDKIQYESSKALTDNAMPSVNHNISNGVRVENLEPSSKRFKKNEAEYESFKNGVGLNGLALSSTSSEISGVAQPVKRSRGRPKGTKNKITDNAEKKTRSYYRGRSKKPTPEEINGFYIQEKLILRSFQMIELIQIEFQNRNINYCFRLMEEYGFLRGMLIEQREIAVKKCRQLVPVTASIAKYFQQYQPITDSSNSEGDDIISTGKEIMAKECPFNTSMNNGAVHNIPLVNNDGVGSSNDGLIISSSNSNSINPNFAARNINGGMSTMNCNISNAPIYVESALGTYIVPLGSDLASPKDSESPKLNNDELHDKSISDESILFAEILEDLAGNSPKLFANINSEADHSKTLPNNKRDMPSLDDDMLESEMKNAPKNGNLPNDEIVFDFQQLIDFSSKEFIENMFDDLKSNSSLGESRNVVVHDNVTETMNMVEKEKITEIQKEDNQENLITKQQQLGEDTKTEKSYCMTIDSNKSLDNEEQVIEMISALEDKTLINDNRSTDLTKVNKSKRNHNVNENVYFDWMELHESFSNDNYSELQEEDNVKNVRPTDINIINNSNSDRNVNDDTSSDWELENPLIECEDEQGADDEHGGDEQQGGDDQQGDDILLNKNTKTEDQEVDSGVESCDLVEEKDKNTGAIVEDKDKNPEAKQSEDSETEIIKSVDNCLETVLSVSCDRNTVNNGFMIENDLNSIRSVNSDDCYKFAAMDIDICTPCLSEASSPDLNEVRELESNKNDNPNGLEKDTPEEFCNNLDSSAVTQNQKRILPNNTILKKTASCFQKNFPFEEVSELDYEYENPDDDDNEEDDDENDDEDLISLRAESIAGSPNRSTFNACNKNRKNQVFWKKFVHKLKKQKTNNGLFNAKNECLTKELDALSINSKANTKSPIKNCTEEKNLPEFKIPKTSELLVAKRMPAAENLPFSNTKSPIKNCTEEKNLPEFKIPKTSGLLVAKRMPAAENLPFSNTKSPIKNCTEEKNLPEFKIPKTSGLLVAKRMPAAENLPFSNTKSPIKNCTEEKNLPEFKIPKTSELLVAKRMPAAENLPFSNTKSPIKNCTEEKNLPEFKIPKTSELLVAKRMPAAENLPFSNTKSPIKNCTEEKNLPEFKIPKTSGLLVAKRMPAAENLPFSNTKSPIKNCTEEKNLPEFKIPKTSELLVAKRMPAAENLPFSNTKSPIKNCTEEKNLPEFKIPKTSELLVAKRMPAAENLPFSNTKSPIKNCTEEKNLPEFKIPKTSGLLVAKRMPAAENLPFSNTKSPIKNCTEEKNLPEFKIPKTSELLVAKRMPAAENLPFSNTKSPIKNCTEEKNLSEFKIPKKSGLLVAKRMPAAENLPFSNPSRVGNATTNSNDFNTNDLKSPSVNSGLTNINGRKIIINRKYGQGAFNKDLSPETSKACTAAPCNHLDSGNRNVGCTEFKFRGLFGLPCFKFLNNDCMTNNCKYSHNALYPPIIKCRLESLNDEDLCHAFNFALTSPLIFKLYHIEFIELFIQKKKFDELTDLIIYCGRNPHLFQTILVIFSNMVKNGETKLNSANIIFCIFKRKGLHNFDNRLIDVIVDILFYADWTKCLKNISDIASLDSYEFKSQTIIEMADYCNSFHNNTRANRTLLKCIMKNQSSIESIKSAKIKEFLERMQISQYQLIRF